MSKTLTGRTIVLPESRELNLFASMVEKRGATVLRCPFITILDAPDPAPILAWLRQLIDGSFDDLILLTGEGLRRLLGFAEREGVKDNFIASLDKVRKITRGPKPARALREIGLKSNLTAETPTTEGVIETLTKEDIKGHNIGVQLYGTHPNTLLIDFLCSVGATPYTVSPYVYSSHSDDELVRSVIKEMAEGYIDVIAFTSGPQVKRLFDVAHGSQLNELLLEGLERTKVAAVGPVVAETLAKRGIHLDMTPPSSYFMKPLVNEIVAAIGKDSKKSSETE
jgi:uroporphyrinogen-III synthase